MWQVKQLTLSPYRRGFHLVTDEILRHLSDVHKLELGLLHLFLQHTSASLSINENADETVRTDLEAHFNVLAPEQAPYYEHTYEGDDDMPAHIKASIIGCEITIPIKQGKLALGTWQGIYLGEHRNQASSRTIVATLTGQLAQGMSE